MILIGDDGKIVLRSGQQQVGGVAQGVARLERVILGQHGLAYRDILQGDALFHLDGFGLGADPDEQAQPA